MNSLPRMILCGLAVAGTAGACLAQTTPPQRAIEETDMASRLAAPQSPLKKPDGVRVVPQLLEDELEDIGPQYLLLEKPRHKWFQLILDGQAYHTTNAILSESNHKEGNVSVSTVQPTVVSPAFDVLGGAAQAKAGFRWQMFRYGMWAGSDDIPTGGTQALDTNDFNAYTPFGEVNWQREEWLASAGYRYANLQGRSSNQTFYDEHVPYWMFGRQFALTDSLQLLVQYDGAFRFTDTDSGSLPVNLRPTDSINDRTDQAASLILSQVLFERLVVQPSYRFQYSKYISPSRVPTREDYYNTGTLLVAYYFTDYFSLRVFGSVERRDSTDPATADYSVWNLGGGANLTLNF